MKPYSFLVLISLTVIGAVIVIQIGAVALNVDLVIMTIGVFLVLSLLVTMYAFKNIDKLSKQKTGGNAE